VDLFGVGRGAEEPGDVGQTLALGAICEYCVLNVCLAFAGKRIYQVLLGGLFHSDSPMGCLTSEVTHEHITQRALRT